MQASIINSELQRLILGRMHCSSSNLAINAETDTLLFLSFQASQDPTDSNALIPVLIAT